jgi:hypothetical protein
MDNTIRPTAEVVNINNAVGGLDSVSLASTDVTQPTQVDGTPTASFGGAARMAALSGLLALGGTFVVSCDDKGVEPTEQVDPNALTPEQQRFAELLAPNADGTPKSITVDIGDPSSPFYMPKLFRIELKLVNAKAGTLEITPYISKAPIANALKNAEIAEPGKGKYATNLGLIVKKQDGSDYSPTNTVTVINKDDNDPLTVSPGLEQLDDAFTFDIFKQFNPNNNTVKKSYMINKTDELQLRIETETYGIKFEKVILPIKPVEISAVQNTGN